MRQDRPIDTTLELVELIKAAVPPSYRRAKHPARKTFQALRIEVNDELGAVEEVLPQTVNLLNEGGRLCNYFSLTGRPNRQAFYAEGSSNMCLSTRIAGMYLQSPS